MSSSKGWAREEDDKIIALVNLHGIKKWSVVAAELPDRNGKQCRERWHNQLDPSIKRGPWSFEEDEILLRAHAEYGSKWSVIAKCLPGRTDNSIKNRWNSALRRELRKLNRETEDVALGRGPPPQANMKAANAVDSATLANPARSYPDSDAPESLELAAEERLRNGLRAELNALGHISGDDHAKAALRTKLVEQLCKLNATWKETDTQPSANHIQELGKQVSRLQDFCRDLVGSSLTRHQRELASGVVPKRRQCMARSRRRTTRVLSQRKEDGHDDPDRTVSKRFKTAHGVLPLEHGSAGSDADDFLDASASAEGSGDGSGGDSARAVEHGVAGVAIPKASEADVEVELNVGGGASGTGARGAWAPGCTVQTSGSNLASRFPNRFATDEIAGLGEDLSRTAPVLTPNGTNLLSFDVDELLQLTSSTLADVLASPRGAPLVTLSPASNTFSFNLAAPQEGQGQTGPASTRIGRAAAPRSTSPVTTPSPTTLDADPTTGFAQPTRWHSPLQCGSRTLNIPKGTSANVTLATTVCASPLSCRPVPHTTMPTPNRKPSSLSERRRPVGATNLQITSAAGERPRAPSRGDRVAHQGERAKEPGANADVHESAPALPTPLKGDPLAMLIMSDVSL